MANLIKTSDKRQSFTHNEVLQIALALKDRTEVLSSGTDYTYESDKKVYFYWYRIKKFTEFPSFIGWVHQQYGRGLDIRTYWNNEENGTIDVYFKGYARDIA